MVGQVTDRMFLEALDTKLASHAHYSSRLLNRKDSTMQFHEHFRVKHYAGDVTYLVNGFIDKNRDTLFQDLKRLMCNRYKAVDLPG